MRTFAAVLAPLQPCPAYTVTPDQFAPEDMAEGDFQASATSSASMDVITSLDQCSTMPGYGWEDGVAVPCPIGYWAHGYDNGVSWRAGSSLDGARHAADTVTAVHCVATRTRLYFCP